MHVGIHDIEMIIDRCRILKSLKPSSAVPATAYILLSASAKRTFFATTDVQTMAVVDVTGLVAVYEPGDILIPAAPFFKKAEQFGDEAVQIKGNEKTCDFDNLKLMTLSPKEFPPVPRGHFKHPVVVSELALHLDRIAHAVASSNDTRYALQGVNFDLKGGYLVATNGHILHAVHIKKGDFLAIVPMDVVNLLRKIRHDIEISRDNGHLRFQNDTKSISLYAKPTEGTYPDWARLVPGKERKGEFSFTVNREAMIEALAAVRKMATNKTVTITQTLGRISIEGKLQTGRVTEKVKAQTKGVGQFAVDISYVHPAIQSLSDVDDVTVRWKGIEPIVIKSASEYKDVILVMPIRMDKPANATKAANTEPVETH